MTFKNVLSFLFSKIAPLLVKKVKKPSGKPNKAAINVDNTDI